MPKQTFYNLSKDKQKKIFDAAFSEFSRVSFNEASIASIIKRANIPRGSFYQYFENKEDLYFYIIDRVHGCKKIHFQDLLFKFNGDIFRAFEEMFIQELELTNDENYRSFFKHLFLNLNIHLSAYLTDRIMQYQKNMHEIIEGMDKSKFKEQDISYIWNVLRLIKMISRESVTMKLSKEISNAEVLAVYRKQIDIIKYGALKQDE